MMYLQVICVVLFGFVVEKISAGARDKLHIKIHVPAVVKHHHHDKYIIHHKYLKPHSHGGYHPGPAKPKPHKPHKHHKQQPKKTQSSPGFHYGNDNPYISEPYTGKYQQSWKTLKSEKYETETVDNPFSNNPANKYIVKSSYKVREKLPFEDATIGYDQEFLYPISETEHDYQKNEKVVDYNNAKTDPFPGNLYDVPLKNDLKEEKKPKEYNYYYKYPTSDYEYQKNVHLVDYYLNNNEPNAALHEEENNKFDDYGFNNNADYDTPKPDKHGKYQVSDFDHLGPSDEESYQNYKTDGPIYDFD